MAKKGSKSMGTHPLYLQVSGNISTRTNKSTVISKVEITPGVIELTALHQLPSYSAISMTSEAATSDGKEALQAPEKTLLKALRRLNSIDPLILIGGFGAPLLNLIQIWMMSILEYCFRTTGAVLVTPVNKIQSKIIKGLYIISPVWQVGQSFMSIAGALSSLRQLFDSLNYVFNLAWWGKTILNNDTPPTIGTVFKKLGGAIANLIIPSVAIASLSMLPHYLEPITPALTTGLIFTSIYVAGLFSVANQLSTARVEVSYNKDAKIQKKKNHDLIRQSQQQKLQARPTSTALMQIVVNGIPTVENKEEKEEKVEKETKELNKNSQSEHEESQLIPEPPSLNPPAYFDGFSSSLLVPEQLTGNIPADEERKSLMAAQKISPTKILNNLSRRSTPNASPNRSARNTPSKLFNANSETTETRENNTDDIELTSCRRTLFSLGTD